MNVTLVKDIPTPALVLEHGKLLGNIERMTLRVRELGVSLRPHLKTGKSIDIARLLNGPASVGITVSTLREAGYFADHGVNDILYAVSIVPQKLGRIAELIRRGVRLSVILDLPETAREVAVKAEELGIVLDVLIEIDTDGHRAGIEPEDPALMEIAKVLEDAPNTRLKGVMTHAGESYECASVEEIAVHAELERSRCVLAAEILRSEGFPCEVISVGSTPTALCARKLDGVTELRAGVYVFFDLFQAGLGVCDVTDISLSVLATVISHKHSHRRIIIDAGGLALSKDRSTATQQVDCGYGLVATADTGELIPGLRVQSANQEHGIIPLAHPDDFKKYPVGSRFRIIPNHACMTAAAHDRYYVVDGSDTVIAEWDRCNGW